jgi:hypothetical protein
MDPYPTYRDGPTTPHRVTATKPTDTDLPIAKRSYALPMLIGLAVFALVIIARIVWGGLNMTTSTDEAVTPGDATSPAAATAPATTGDAVVPENNGSFDTDVRTDMSTGPAAIGDEPGPVDVPGGEATAPGAAPAGQ